MRYTLTSDELDLQSSLRSFLSTLVPINDYERICESDEGFDGDVWKRLTSHGWLDLHAMSAEAEASAWPIAGVVMAEEFGRTLVPAPVELVAGFLLPLLGRLEPGSFGLTLEHEPFVDEVPTVCVEALLPLVYQGRPGQRSGLAVEERDGGVRLTGRLPAVQFAGVASWLFLPVELSTGWGLARVHLGAAGVIVQAVSTVDPGRTSASVTLDAVEIPKADLVLNAADGSSVEGHLTEALMSYLLFLDGKAIGACEVLLERTLAYVKEREQFDVAIGSFQAIKHKVADMATTIEASRSLASFTAWEVAQRHADRDEAVLASRLYCADAYRRVCELAIQCHGGMGFTWEVGLHFWYRSATHDSAVADLTLGDLARVLGVTA